LKATVLLILAAFAATAVEAQQGMAFHGWGLRGGVSDRPDEPGEDDGIELALSANELQNAKLVFRWMF
jgi:hypothetical protein